MMLCWACSDMWARRPCAGVKLLSCHVPELGQIKAEEEHVSGILGIPILVQLSAI